MCKHKHEKRQNKTNEEDKTLHSVDLMWLLTLQQFVLVVGRTLAETVSPVFGDPRQK